jgi:hypothetical protein
VVGISTVNPLAVDGIPGQLETLLGALPSNVRVVLGGPSASALLERISDSRLHAVESLADFRAVLGELARD